MEICACLMPHQIKEKKIHLYGSRLVLKIFFLPGPLISQKCLHHWQIDAKNAYWGAGRRGRGGGRGFGYRCVKIKSYPVKT
jgi:hypothetical protein